MGYCVAINFHEFTKIKGVKLYKIDSIVVKIVSIF